MRIQAAWVGSAGGAYLEIEIISDPMSVLLTFVTEEEADHGKLVVHLGRPRRHL